MIIRLKMSQSPGNYRCIWLLVSDQNFGVCFGFGLRNQKFPARAEKLTVMNAMEEVTCEARGLCNIIHIYKI